MRPRLHAFHNKLAELIPCEPKSARADLHRMGARELLGRYVNWADRFVPPRPRRVVTWEGFLRHGSPRSHREAVYDLVKKIEAGDDLTPFLSDEIHRLWLCARQRREHQEARHRMGRQRLRLERIRDASPAPENQRVRGELLYVSFSRDDAFLVMLGNHKSFDDGNLAQAIAEARVGTAHELKGILGPAAAALYARAEQAPAVRLHDRSSG